MKVGHRANVMGQQAAHLQMQASRLRYSTLGKQRRQPFPNRLQYHRLRRRRRMQVIFQSRRVGNLLPTRLMHLFAYYCHYDTGMPVDLSLMA